MHTSSVSEHNGLGVWQWGVTLLSHVFCSFCELSLHGCEGLSLHLCLVTAVFVAHAFMYCQPKFCIVTTKCCVNEPCQRAVVNIPFNTKELVPMTAATANVNCQYTMSKESGATPQMQGAVNSCQI